MKLIFGIVILSVTVFSSHDARSQPNRIDSLKKIVKANAGEREEAEAWLALGEVYYNENRLDSSAISFEKALLIASNIDDDRIEATALMNLGDISWVLGNYGQGMALLFRSSRIYEQIKDPDGPIEIHMLLQSAYRESGDFTNALKHAFIVLRGVEKSDKKGVFLFPGLRILPLILAEIGETYQFMNKLDSAEFYARKSIDEKLMFNEATWNFPIFLLGKIQTKQGKYDDALRNYKVAIPLATKNGIFKDTLDIYNSIAELYKITDKLDSAIYYGKAITDRHPPHINIRLSAVTTLADVYKLKQNTDSAFKYLELSSALKDSIYGVEKQKELQNAIFNEHLGQMELAEEQQRLKSRILTFSLIAGLIIVLSIVLILYRSNQHKQTAKLKVEKAYDDLKAAQKQLIQSEKMASLGELTAGIAHEIQNPLNFVNNFSEVNTELIDELRKELADGNVRSAGELAGSIADNEQKINHHGKRADVIVKNMLQHSRTSSGHKEITDLNQVCEEYIRLAYHGYRAKDKSFNATFEKVLDPSLPKIAVVPQDIGRVILNLINNASYAVNEKSKAGIPGYTPTVKVVTRKFGDKVEIRIEDNGMGIPESIKEKIFQPFFSTKPTGRGTGLGLSLSYDILKAHGGTLEVISKEGEGSEFVVQMPV